MNPTYILNKDGKVVTNIQQPIDVEKIKIEIQDGNNQIKALTRLVANRMQQLVDIADQIPREADDINAIPEIVDFRNAQIESISPAITPASNT